MAVLATLVGVLFGSLLLTVCLREVLFRKDETRRSWVNGALAASIVGPILSSIGNAEEGALSVPGAVNSLVVGLVLSLTFFVWSYWREGSEYQRRKSGLVTVFSWFWLCLLIFVSALKVYSGLR